MTPWGKKWEKQEKSGKMRQTNVAIVWVLDWVGLKTTQVRPAFRLQDYTTAQKNEEKKKPPQHHSAYSLSLPHERGKYGNKNIYNTFRLPICDIKKRESLFFKLLMKLVMWKRPRSRFPHLLHVSLWEWLSLNGFPPVPHRVTDKAENSPVSLRLK